MNFDSDSLTRILGRQEYQLDFLSDQICDFYRNKNILITGANGRLGHGVREYLYSHKVECNIINTDIEIYPQDKSWIFLNVENYDQVMDFFEENKIDIVLHFAADKHAPKGELTPDNTIGINLEGTRNIICGAEISGSKVILASTCKSCNPETVYGATKLIAERLTLNAGHNVSRFYNVVQSSDNVFEIWNKIEDPSLHEVMSCRRYFITIKEAVILTLFSGIQESGRYTINPGEIRHMANLHYDLYGSPGIDKSARRGDRYIELRNGTSESIVALDNFPLEKIVSEHDASV